MKLTPFWRRRDLKWETIGTLRRRRRQSLRFARCCPMVNRFPLLRPRQCQSSRGTYRLLRNCFLIRGRHWRAWDPLRGCRAEQVCWPGLLRIRVLPRIRFCTWPARRDEVRGRPDVGPVSRRFCLPGAFLRKIVRQKENCGHHRIKAIDQQDRSPRFRTPLRDLRTSAMHRYRPGHRPAERNTGGRAAVRR